MMEKQLEDMEQVLYIHHIDSEADFLVIFVYQFEKISGISLLSLLLLFFCLFSRVSLSLSQKGLNCRLAERDTFIITIIQNAMMEGRIQKTTFQGEATVENLDPDTVTKLLHYLELTDQVTMFISRQDTNKLPNIWIISFNLEIPTIVCFSSVGTLTCSFYTTPTVSGARVHHAGSEEEPSGQ